MAGMTSIYVGVSGLQSAQTALNTTTHNLANVYTKGYTRQLSFTSDRTYNNINKDILVHLCLTMNETVVII